MATRVFYSDCVANDSVGPSTQFYIDLCCFFAFQGVRLGKFENDTRDIVRSILLQEVLAYINEGARSTVVGEFVDKGLGLLYKAFDGS
jgi:hypothetical protein